MNQEAILKKDMQKLHAEVNQIVSQRFQLTTLAILVFAAVCGWATATVNRPGGISVEFVAVVTVLVVAVLSAIFSYFMLLLGMMRIFTVYLSQKHNSHWETDWAQYRRRPQSKTYWGYSKAGTTVFMLLGPLAFGFLLVLSALSGDFEWRPLLWLPTVVVVNYIVMVGFAGWARQRLIDENEIRENWKAAIKDASNNRTPEVRG